MAAAAAAAAASTALSAGSAFLARPSRGAESLRSSASVSSSGKFSARVSAAVGPSHRHHATCMVATTQDTGAKPAVQPPSQAAAEGLALSPSISSKVLGVILGGGAGSRLYPLTKKRAKPAVPLGANYRLIDIPVSNCINSNIRKIYVLTQFNSASLNRHLSRAYSSNMGTYNNQGFVEVLAAQQSPENPDWFQGTADAVRQYMWLFEEQNVEEFLILAGDHLYRMDYEAFVIAHRESGADITIGALPCTPTDAEAFGIMRIDETGRINEFAEKPKGAALEAMKSDTTVLGLDAKRAKDMPYIASMGIYVFRRDALFKLLQEDFPNAIDFGGEVIPGAKDIGMKVQAYLFDGYWQDIGTIGAFYEANLALCDDDAPFTFWDKTAPIFTQSRYLPPSRVLNSEITKSIIGEGCLVESGCRIHHSVIGLRGYIAQNCVVEDALLMGADYYETDAQREAVRASGGVPMGLNEGAVVRKCIIDKNARIGKGAQIINKDNIQEAEREAQGYIIKNGIVTIIKDAKIPDSFII
eukprot:jgi/Chlat1/4326/Chrsp29S04483